MSNKRPAPTFGIGVFFGLLVGSIVTISVMSGDTSETFEDYRSRQDQSRGGGGSQHGGGGDPHAQGSGDPHAKGGGDPHAQGGGDPHGQGGGGQPRADRAAQSAAKSHFMKNFVAALTAMPANHHPNPEYKPLLKEGAQISCQNCHDPQQFNIEGMKGMDPGSKAVDKYRKQPMFMIPLMQKWVERLNKRNADKLVKPVTCVDCHAVDPTKKFEIYPPLMNSFVSALREKPKNKYPAKGWKPLLKDPKKGGMLCGTCHGQIGTLMEAAVKDGRLKLIRPPQADNKAFMVSIMEKWVKRINLEMKDELVKPVVCLDCHGSDPRR